MIVVGVCCALGIAGVLAEMLGILPELIEERRARETSPSPPLGTVSFRGHSIICPGLIGWLGTWGYLAAWAWLPAAAWRVHRTRRMGGTLRPPDVFLPSLVTIEILALQLLLRGTLLLSEGYPLL